MPWSRSERASNTADSASARADPAADAPSDARVRRRRAPARSRRVERPQVVEPLADADQLHRQAELVARSRPRCRPSPMPSSFVRTTPVTPTASSKRRACCSPFWPVVASRTSSVSCGAPSRRPADDAADLRELVHQVRLRVQPAGGVDDHDVTSPRARPDRVVGDRGRVAAALAAARTRARALAPRPRAAPRPRRGRCRRRRACTSRPCSRSFCASLPIVVVLPGAVDADDEDHRRRAASTSSRGGSSEQRRDLLGERRAAKSLDGPAGASEPPHELGSRAHADVGRDERLLEPLPRTRRPRGRTPPRRSARRAPAGDFASDSRRRPKNPRRSASSSCGPSASPRSSAHAAPSAAKVSLRRPLRPGRAASVGGRRRRRLVAREPARDDLRDAVGAHRDAVEDVGRLHRPLLVRETMNWARSAYRAAGSRNRPMFVSSSAASTSSSR